MAKLERRRVVEHAQLARDGFLDFLAGVPGTAGPQAGQRIVDLAALVVGQVTAFGGHDQTWVALEIAVSGVGHPVSVELELAGQTGWSVFRQIHEQDLARCMQFY
ncbi:hypothetical protein D3C84_364200 [compost metagenome]